MLLDTLTVNVVGDISNLNSSLSRAQTSVHKFGSDVSSKMTGASSAVTSAGAKMSAGLTQPLMTIDRVSSALTSVGTKMSAGLTLPLAAVGSFALSSVANLEQTKIAFTTLLGSAEKAGSYMKELEAFAARTPFEFPDLATAASRLMAVGIESKRIIPLMTVLGDVTSAMGTGSEGINRAVRALMQMKQKTKVTAEEMLQLTEAGIPAWDALASVLGVSVAKAQDMVFKRQVDTNKIFKALETSAIPGLRNVSGMMDKQSQSLKGLWSTMKDIVSLQLAPALSSFLPFIKNLVKGISNMAIAFGKLNPFWQRFIIIGTALAAAIGPVLVFLGSIISAISTIIPVIGTIAGAITGPVLLIAAAVAAAAYLIFTNWDKVVAFFKANILPVIQPVIDAFKFLGTAIGDSFKYGDITYFTDALGKLLGLPITGFIESMTAQFGTLSGVFKGIWDGLDFQPILTALSAAWTGFMAMLTPVLTFVKALIADAMGFISSQMAVVVEWVTANWPLIQKTIQTVMDVIAKIIRVNLAVTKAVWDAVWPYIKIVVVTVWNVIKTVIGTAIKVVLGIIKAIMQLITGDWKGAWQTIKNTAVTLVSGLAKAVGQLLSGLAQIVSKAVKGAWNAIKGWVSKFAQVGRDLIQGLIDAVREKAMDIGQAIFSGLRKAIAWVKKILGIGSPSKVFYRFGAQMMQGMANGIAQTAGKVTNALGNVEMSMSRAAPGVGLAGAGVSSSVTYGDTYLTVEATVSSDYDVERLGARLSSILERQRRAAGTR